VPPLVDLDIRHLIVVVAVAVEVVVDGGRIVPVVPGLVSVDPAAAVVAPGVVVPVVPVVSGLNVGHPAVAVLDHHFFPVVGLVPIADAYITRSSSLFFSVLAYLASSSTERKNP
jgi:hypothetical protein